MTIYHNGVKIPQAAPKDSNSDVWYGFKYPLDEDELILTSSWLINDTAVTNNTAIAGLTMKASAKDNGVTKINLSGGTINKTYLITNRITTNKVPQDDRSFYIKVVKL